MTTQEAAGVRTPKPLIEGRPGTAELATLWAVVIVPFVALFGGVPAAIAIGWTPNWAILITAVVTYVISLKGIGVGFHRYFTHGSFKAKRPLRIALAIAGSLGIEGNIIQWVADHRRHHQFSDLEGDPHSPWAYGRGARGMAKGLWHAHVGWLFSREFTNRARFAPDLLADKDIRLIDRLFPVWMAISLLGPGVAFGLITWSWSTGLSAFFWAGLVRMAFLHHVTWSVNSVCHAYGEQPFLVRSNQADQARNFWPLAILTGGESWHNLHHADPTCARHGVMKGQIDTNARTIWLFEKLGWAYDVKWPNQKRLNKLRVVDQAAA